VREVQNSHNFHRSLAAVDDGGVRLASAVTSTSVSDADGVKRLRLLGLAFVATAFTLAIAPPALAGNGIGTQPPGSSDAKGLNRAFTRAHKSQKDVRLVGFRVFEARPCGAAYFLTTGGPGGTFARGDFELYKRRSGHRWARTSKAKCAFNLYPTFIWKVESVGSGSWVTRDTTTDQEGLQRSERTDDRLSWDLVFGKKGKLWPPGLLGGADSRSKIAIQTSHSTTSRDNPAENSSCQGTMQEKGSPDISTKEKGSKLLFTVELAPELGETSCGDQLDGDRLIASVKVPAGRFEEHVASFTEHFDSSNPDLVKTVGPHSGGTDVNGDVTTTSSRDLSFSGTLSFALVGVELPRGLLGIPPAKRVPVE
jgi:hypothetical protein